MADFVDLFKKTMLTGVGRKLKHAAIRGITDRDLARLPFVELKGRFAVFHADSTRRQSALD